MEEIITLKASKTLETNNEQGFFYDALSKKFGVKTNIHMFIATIQPGEYIPAHSHPNGSEAMIYNLSGSLELKYGEGLQKSVIIEPGDFIYIPGNVPHQPINLSQTEPVKSIVACNFDVSEQSN